MDLMPTIMKKPHEVPEGQTGAASDGELHALDRLVGTWRMSGDAEGQVRWEWAEGRRFLLQHIDIVHGGRTIKGLEVIGHLHSFDGEPSADIHSRVYSFLDGLTLDYVYECAGDTLTIWGGERGSPAFYRGTFSSSGDTLTGAWTWPGGGYKTVARRTE
jgi:hypothetical protein